MKTHIKLCSGTACYVMGGAEILLLKDNFSKEEQEEFTIEISNCLDLCQTDDLKSPYAIINGKVHSNVSLKTIISEIRNNLKR